jgi:hypothetical protein
MKIAPDKQSTVPFDELLPGDTFRLCGKHYIKVSKGYRRNAVALDTGSPVIVPKDFGVVPTPSSTFYPEGT